MRFGDPQQYEWPANAGQEQLHLRTGQTFLERMGVLYADRIRLNIVTELNMREMSPRQFYEQVGGTSISSVRRHFTKLVEFGWLRKVRTLEGDRPGRREVLYRTTELAVIDDETWEQIPVSIRDSFTVQNILEMGERLQVSLASGTFNQTGGNVLSFMSLKLDEPGWVKAIAALNGCFRSLSLEQTDAKLRLEGSGDVPILMIVELGGFEIPVGMAGPRSVPLPTGTPGQSIPPWPHRISKIFRDPLNLAIMNRLNDKPMSPTQLHHALGGLSMEGFDRRCKMLVKLGWVAKVEQKTGGERRGATENFYRATSPASSPAELFGDEVPRAVRESEAWQVFELFCRSALDSVRSGTFNCRPDRHLTLCALLVDETGREQVAQSLTKCVKALTRIEAEARRRVENAQRPTSKIGVGCLVGGFASPIGKARPMS